MLVYVNVYVGKCLRNFCEYDDVRVLQSSCPPFTIISLYIWLHTIKSNAHIIPSCHYIRSRNNLHRHIATYFIFGLVDASPHTLNHWWNILTISTPLPYKTYNMKSSLSTHSRTTWPLSISLLAMPFTYISLSLLSCVRVCVFVCLCLIPYFQPPTIASHPPPHAACPQMHGPKQLT